MAHSLELRCSHKDSPFLTACCQQPQLYLLSMTFPPGMLADSARREGAFIDIAVTSACHPWLQNQARLQHAIRSGPIMQGVC